MSRLEVTIATLLHNACIARWREQSPDVMTTMHGPEAHEEAAERLLRDADRAGIIIAFVADPNPDLDQMAKDYHDLPSSEFNVKYGADWSERATGMAFTRALERAEAARG